MHQRMNLNIMNNYCSRSQKLDAGVGVGVDITTSLWLRRKRDVKPPDISGTITEHVTQRLFYGGFLSEFSGRQVTLTHSAAGSRRRPRQQPWIKDGYVTAPRNRPAWPFLWPAVNDSDIWFSPLFWGVIASWSAEPGYVKELSIRFLLCRGAECEPTQPAPGEISLGLLMNWKV